MKLKEYTENLLKFMKDRPESADLDVITAADDEGNYYNEVHCEPTLGCYSVGEFYGEDAEELDEDGECNAVCIN